MNAFRLIKLASRLALPEQLKVLRALILLGYLNLAVKFMPFSRVIRLGSVPIKAPTSDFDDVVEDSVRTLKRASFAAPWRSVCIHEGLALQLMMRRKGIPAILCYGTAQLRGELKSHVWVKVGDTILIGGEAAPDFRLLATYPATQ